LPDALERIHRAYTSAPIAEDVEITLATPAGVSRRDVFIALDAQPSGIRAMFLELGPLRVFAESRAEGGRLLIDRPLNHREYAEIELRGPIAPALLARHMPPVPLPQIAIASGVWSVDYAAPGADDAGGELSFTGVRWLGAAIDPRGQRLTLVGRAGPDAAAPSVRVSADALTGRVLDASIEWSDRASALDLRVRAIEIPDAPLAWRVTPDGRERVPTAADLLVSTEPRRIGTEMPELPLVTASGAGWPWRTLLDAPPGEPLSAGRVAVLILARNAVLREDPDAVARLFVALRAAAGKDAEGISVTPAVALGAIVDLSAWTPDHVRDIAEAWKDRARVVYAIGGSATLDAIAPGADAVAVVIGPAGEILGIIEPPASSGDALRDGEARAQLTERFRVAFEPIRRLVRVHREAQGDPAHENAPDAGGEEDPD
jgi:hypothetical protein